MASGHCLVIDVLLSLTVDGHRIEERRALEESRLEADARDSALALETAHRHFLRGQSPGISYSFKGVQWISYRISTEFKWIPVDFIEFKGDPSGR